jgi:uncharacterized protein YihD (DUF1040 family)
MRDPERIPMILQALEREWRKSPDLRFGQFMVNLIRKSRLNSGDDERSLFSIEDGNVLALLGAETDEEKAYIREEPAKAKKEGWAEMLREQRGNKEREKRLSDAESTDGPT